MNEKRHETINSLINYHGLTKPNVTLLQYPNLRSR